MVDDVRGGLRREEGVGGGARWGSRRAQRGMTHTRTQIPIGLRVSCTEHYAQSRRADEPLTLSDVAAVFFKSTPFMVPA